MELESSGPPAAAGQAADAVTIAEADRAADVAARTARVRVSLVEDVAGVIAVGQLFDRIWASSTGSVLPEEVLRMYRLTGQYLALAYGDTRPEDTRPGDDARPDDSEAAGPIAASVGLFSAPSGRVLHSHVTGVLPAGLGRAVGFALKAHQRAWALRQGIGTITWTFDPLIRRNAWFNLTKLAARPVRYLEDFYGAMPDEINAGDASDRLYLTWSLASPAVSAACSGRPAPPEPAQALREKGFRDLVEISGDGARRAVGLPEDGPGVLVATPEDAEALRRRDLAAALSWRHAVRAALTEATGAGLVVTGFTPDGHYVLTRPSGGSDGIDEGEGA